MDQPGGPINQRLTRSGLVSASKTNRRGAWNARVITSSRSPCAVNFKASVWLCGTALAVFASTFFLLALLVLPANHRAAGSSAPKYAGTFPPRIPGPSGARAAGHRSAVARPPEQRPVRRHSVPANVWRLAVAED